MKKPTYNWRILLGSMSYGTEYTFTQMVRKIAAIDADRTTPTTAQMMAIIRACGVFLEVNKKGNYLLTAKGFEFIENQNK